MRNVATEDQTIHRRILLTLGSGVLSTTAEDGGAVATGVAGVTAGGVDACDPVAPHNSLSA